MPISSDDAQRITISASTGAYTVAITDGLVARLIAAGGDRVFIVDERLAGPFVAARLNPIVLTANEPAKSLDRMTDIVLQLRERRVTRKTTLVAVGGGIIQDIAAFAASTYMRGIDWIYVPTTLLSMTDSCIGGKSSINVGPYKNIVGTFHPPVEVQIDPHFIATLTDEQRAAGLCEAAKICLCRDGAEFDAYIAARPSASGPASQMADIIDRSLRAKKWFIEIDEFDRGVRLNLNFGHTFGHAIETATDFAVSHGIAVGLGMIAAVHLGEELGRSYDGNARIGAFLDHIDELLRAVDGLSVALGAATIETLMDAFESDKKHSGDDYAVIVPNADGVVERVTLTRNATNRALIERAFARLLAERSGSISEGVFSRLESA